MHPAIAHGLVDAPAGCDARQLRVAGDAAQLAQRLDRELRLIHGDEPKQTDGQLAMTATDAGVCPAVDASNCPSVCSRDSGR